MPRLNEIRVIGPSGRFLYNHFEDIPTQKNENIESFAGKYPFTLKAGVPYSVPILIEEIEEGAPGAPGMEIRKKIVPTQYTAKHFIDWALAMYGKIGLIVLAGETPTESEKRVSAQRARDFYQKRINEFNIEARTNRRHTPDEKVKKWAKMLGIPLAVATDPEPSKRCVCANFIPTAALVCQHCGQKFASDTEIQEYITGLRLRQEAEQRALALEGVTTDGAALDQNELRLYGDLRQFRDTPVKIPESEPLAQELKRPTRRGRPVKEEDWDFQERAALQDAGVTA